VRLLQRTTRSLSLTDDGAAYYARCKSILHELEDAESSLARAAREPRGRLRVDAPVVLGRFVLGPALPDFLAHYPELAIDLSVRDHLIDPIAEGVDVTLRMGDLRDSELASRKLGEMRMVIAGSPRYFARHGRPQHPDDLAHHHLIGFLLSGATAMPWQFRAGHHHAVRGRLVTNSADVQRDAALAGTGLIHMFAFHIADELARGRLEAVLVDHEPPAKPVHALYAGPRAAAPKLRVFLDWAAALVQAKAGVPRPRASGVGKARGRPVAHRAPPGKSRA
jgi:LysR family transcriptional regulator for bpeEF and oprC